MPTSLPKRRRERPPFDGRALALLYVSLVALLLSAMINHPEFFDVVSRGLQAEFAVANPLGDDQAIVLAKVSTNGNCYCD